MDYVDPFKSLNDIKRMEREALLNNPASQQHKSTPVSPNFASLISRRDYFAAAALQGIFSDGNVAIQTAVERSVMAADYLIAVLDASAREEKA